MRSCHCAKSVDSQWGVNRCEQVWTVVNSCEQLWTGVNRYERVWTSGNRCEKFWPGFNSCTKAALSEQVWSTVFPRGWVARSPNFAYPSTKLHHYFPKALKRPRNNAVPASKNNNNNFERNHAGLNHFNNSLIPAAHKAKMSFTTFHCNCLELQWSVLT